MVLDFLLIVNVKLNCRERSSDVMYRERNILDFIRLRKGDGSKFLEFCWFLVVL